MYAHSI